MKTQIVVDYQPVENVQRLLDVDGAQAHLNVSQEMNQEHLRNIVKYGILRLVVRLENKS